MSARAFAEVGESWSIGTTLGAIAFAGSLCLFFAFVNESSSCGGDAVVRTVTDTQGWLDLERRRARRLPASLSGCAIHAQAR